MKQSSKMTIQFGSANPAFGQKMQPSTQTDSRTCPHCGAPILSEVCQYCGTYVGQVATSELTPEYELVHCKNAKLTFWNAAFPAIFGFAFTLPGIAAVLGALSYPYETSGFRARTVLACFMFLLIGVIALILLFMSFKRFLETKKHGVVREGVVYGYMDDVISYNNNNGQQVKILLDTAEGKKFILLPLGTPVKLYEINSPIRVKLYKKFAMITNDAVDNIKW